MLNNWIDLFVYRDILTKGQKWFLFFFNLIVSGFLLVGKILLLQVKLFTWFIGLFFGGNRK